MIVAIHQGLKDEGVSVSISQLCRWFGIPRRTVYYRRTSKTPIAQERFADPIKQMIEANPSFGYRTVAHLLKFNKEHRTARFPAEALAGAQTTRGLPASSPGPAVRGGLPE